MRHDLSPIKPQTCTISVQQAQLEQGFSRMNSKPISIAVIIKARQLHFTTSLCKNLIRQEVDLRLKGHEFITKKHYLKGEGRCIDMVHS